MKYEYKMQEGEKLGRVPNQPVLIVGGSGPDTYLWVGNDAENDMMCFATIGGSANLRRIAQAILNSLDNP